MEEIKGENYIVRSRNLAFALKWLGYDYMRYPSNDHKGMDVYSFKITKEFLEALDMLNKIKKNRPSKIK